MELLFNYLELWPNDIARKTEKEKKNLSIDCFKMYGNIWNINECFFLGDEMHKEQIKVLLTLTFRESGISPLFDRNRPNHEYNLMITSPAAI